MAKSDAVQALVSGVQQGEADVLVSQGNTLYDVGFADGALSVPVTSGGFTQEQLDAAIAKQAADDQVILDAANAKAVADLAALQAGLDAMTAKDQADVAVVEGLKAKAASLKAAIDALDAIILG